MTRREWLNVFDAEVARVLTAAYDQLVARLIAAGGTADDLDLLDEAWRAEADVQVSSLRARAVSALHRLPEQSITWD
jgi:hypothetical protein